MYVWFTCVFLNLNPSCNKQLIFTINTVLKINAYIAPR